MRKAVVSSLVILLVAAARGGAQQAGRPLFFDGARLITGDGTTIERAAFVVRNGRFERGARARSRRPVTRCGSI